MKTTGSLYVKATLRQPSSAAERAMRSGDAESASEVAAGCAERENRGAREEVVQGLLLDRVDAEAAAPAVAREHDRVALAPADETVAELPLVQPAFLRTNVTLNASVFNLVPVLGRVADTREGFHGVPRPHDAPEARRAREGGVS